MRRFLSAEAETANHYTTELCIVAARGITICSGARSSHSSAATCLSSRTSPNCLTGELLLEDLTA